MAGSIEMSEMLSLNYITIQTCTNSLVNECLTNGCVGNRVDWP